MDSRPDQGVVRRLMWEAAAFGAAAEGRGRRIASRRRFRPTRSGLGRRESAGAERHDGAGIADPPVRSPPRLRRRSPPSRLSPEPIKPQD